MELRPLTEDAIDYVLENLSKADRVELEALGMSEPRAVFVAAAQGAPVSGAIYSNGKPIAIYGANPHHDDPKTGIAWMVTTEEFGRSGAAGAVTTRRILTQMQAKFARLTNCVHAEHRRAIRWLKWLGFTVKQDAPIGPDGAFYEFLLES